MMHTLNYVDGGMYGMMWPFGGFFMFIWMLISLGLLALVILLIIWLYRKIIESK